MNIIGDWYNSQIDIIGIVKQRLEDQEIQTWGNEIERSETLSVYKDVKKVFGQEIYFKFNLPSKYLSYWLQLRANCLPLRWRSKVFERGKGFPASRYTCPICNIEEENLDHFLCRCQGLTDLREGILGKSNFSLRGMLSQTVPSLMCRLCRFVDQALKIRKELLWRRFVMVWNKNAEGSCTFVFLLYLMYSVYGPVERLLNTRLLLLLLCVWHCV